MSENNVQYTTGYVCSCGVWVPNGIAHFCQVPFTTVSYPAPKTQWKYCPHCGKTLE